MLKSNKKYMYQNWHQELLRNDEWAGRDKQEEDVLSKKPTNLYTYVCVLK